jgi:septal ring factor EnvC (AmiA/AmiB activator)
MEIMLMATKTRSAKKQDQLPFDTETGSLPATRRMLHLVRDELKNEMKAGFKGVHSEIAQFHSEIAQVRSEFGQLRSEMSLVHSEMSQVRSEMARVGVLVEEQNANNRIVLEGLSGLWQRQGQFETRLQEEVARTVAAALVRAKT